MVRLLGVQSVVCLIVVELCYELLWSCATSRFRRSAASASVPVPPGSHASTIVG